MTNMGATKLVIGKKSSAKVNRISSDAKIRAQLSQSQEVKRGDLPLGVMAS